MFRRSSPLAVIALALALAACGSDDEPQAPEVQREVETVEDLPKLPRGYERHISRTNGLALGRPPGWKANEKGVATFLTAPDELVVMSLSADRSDEAISTDPGTLAAQTFSALRGYEGELDPSDPAPFKHRYDASRVEGRGVSADTGVRQNLSVIVLVREGSTAVTAVVAENAEEKAPAEVRQALESLRTLRTRPVS
jgi:hypothetical protein